MPDTQSPPATIIVLACVLLGVILAAGCDFSDFSDYDNILSISKLSETGELCWTHTYNIGWSRAHTVRVMPATDGGCVVNIPTNTSLLCRISGGGEEVWCIPDEIGEALAQNRAGDTLTLNDYKANVSIFTLNGTRIVTRIDPVFQSPSLYPAYYPDDPTAIGTSDGGFAVAGDFGVVKLDSIGTVLWNTPRGNYTAVTELPDGDFAAIKAYPVWNPTPETFNGTWGDNAAVVRIHEGLVGETLRPLKTKNAELYTIPDGFGIFWYERGGTWREDEVNLVENLTTSRPMNLPSDSVRASNGGYLSFVYEAIRYDTNGSVIWEKKYTNGPIPESTTHRFPTSDGGLIYLGSSLRLRD